MRHRCCHTGNPRILAQNAQLRGLQVLVACPSQLKTVARAISAELRDVGRPGSN